MSSAKTAAAGRRRGAPTKGDRREEQILAATRRLLSHRPIGQVTIDEIASAAGISRTSFYFYFPSKQAVLATLMEQTWNEFTSTHEWFDSDGPDLDGLRAQLAAVAAIWRDNGPILACAAQSGQSDYPPLQEFLGRARERFVARLAAKIERDRAAGLAPDGPATAELATLVAIVRDGRLAELAQGDPDDARDAHALDALTQTIGRMIYGRVG